MKVKLAILERDAVYLSRIVGVFGTKYADKFQIYSFTDPDVAVSALKAEKIEVLVASDAFEIDVNQLPKRCGFAYFVDSADIEMLNGQRAICKFQKADLLYKQILSIYAENAGNLSGVKFGGDGSRLLVFQGPSGGVGASTVAAACAVHFASMGRSVLYLNLERFGSADVFFRAEGQFDMSDIIFALKSKKANLALKLESCVKQADNGVFFYAQPKLALDMLELNFEEKMRLLTELQISGTYDYIVVDADFGIDAATRELNRKAHAVVWVGDGSEISNTKLCRAYSALSTLEQNEDSSVLNRMVLIYNKFSNKTSQTIGDIGLKSIGGAPRFEHATSGQVLGQLSASEIFNALM